MATQANCPSCGAPLTFRPGTMVAVCGYCKSLSARTDRDPRLIGKVADLVDTGSPVRVGLKGKVQDRPFTVVGRTQLRHPLGGVWDEWYLAFEDGLWGWLAEAQGRLYLTFRVDLGVPVPPPEALHAGSTLDLGPAGRWTVAEVSRGTFAAAEGEIPWAVDLESSYPFADLSGPNGTFATLDYGEDPPLLFTGWLASMDQLGLEQAKAAPGRRMKALRLNCPTCAGPLDLRAPDQTQRVTCPSCASLLEAGEGKLSFLKSLEQPRRKRWIELGAEGMLRGLRQTCIGYLVRTCEVEGVTYDWGEYLLMDGHGTFRWLVESDGHWSLAENVPAGEVTLVGDGPSARAVSFRGQALKRFQDVEAQVASVWGEFYWRIAQGETAQVAEFVSAPYSLAQEVQAQPGGGQEVNWSLSTYLEAPEVWAAFKLPGAPPEPIGIAPHQPNPHWAKARSLGRWMLAALGVLLLFLTYEAATHPAKVLYRGTFSLAPAAPAEAPPAPAAGLPAPLEAEPVFFSDPIEIPRGDRNLELRLSAPVSNAWISIEGALASESAPTAEIFEVGASYYFGRDSDGAWSEGGQTDSVFLSAVPAGRYVLRLAPSWEGSRRPVDAFTVELRQGVMRWTYPLLALLAIVLFPLLGAFRALAFESRRWQESMYATTGSA